MHFKIHTKFKNIVGQFKQKNANLFMTYYF
jgi:hypothetical protein